MTSYAYVFPGQGSQSVVVMGELGDHLEARERGIKIARLRQEAMACGTSAAAFTGDCCKGHLDDHGNQIQKAYAQRLREMGLETERVPTSFQEAG